MASTTSPIVAACVRSTSDQCVAIGHQDRATLNPKASIELGQFNVVTHRPSPNSKDNWVRPPRSGLVLPHRQRAPEMWKPNGTPTGPVSRSKQHCLPWPTGDWLKRRLVWQRTARTSTRCGRSNAFQLKPNVWKAACSAENSAERPWSRNKVLFRNASWAETSALKSYPLINPIPALAPDMLCHQFPNQDKAMAYLTRASNKRLEGGQSEARPESPNPPVCHAIGVPVPWT